MTQPHDFYMTRSEALEFLRLHPQTSMAQFPHKTEPTPRGRPTHLFLRDDIMRAALISEECRIGISMALRVVAAEIEGRI